MNWLLDTNVVSETRKPKPASEVVGWIAATPLSQLYTSTINIAELIYGAHTITDILKKRVLDQWIDFTVRPWFAGRLLEVDENVLLRWRIISRERELAREPSSGVDLLMAAVALEHGMGVVTHDVAPFVACHLPVFNPWTGERFNGA